MVFVVRNIPTYSSHITNQLLTYETFNLNDNSGKAFEVKRPMRKRMINAGNMHNL